MEDIILKYGLAGVVMAVLASVIAYTYKDYKKELQKKEKDFKESLEKIVEAHKEGIEELITANKDNILKVAEIALAKDRIHSQERAELREISNVQFKRLNEVTDAGYNVMNANTNILSALKSLIENFKK